MPSACGFACEVCVFSVKKMCPIDHCVAGTNPKAKEKLERFKAVTKQNCFVLECAIKNKVAHCGQCEKFPCDIHYKQQILSNKMLDLIKAMTAK